MNVKHTLWAAVILVIVGGYALFFERGTKPPEPGGVRPLSQILGFRGDRVWKLQVDRKTNPLWIVRDKNREGEAWKIEKPITAPADGEQATQMVKDLADLMVDRVLDEKIADLKPYGLAPPAWELTIATDDGNARTLLVGGKDPTGSSLFLKRKERDEILVVPAYSIESLRDKKAEDLRDKTVIAFKKDEVERFELTSKGKTIRVERAGGDEWRITAPEQAKAKKDKVDYILGTFQALKGSKVVEDNPKDLNKYGLASPAARVAVWVRGDREPLVALLGKKDSAGDVYAKGEKSPTVVTVYSYVMTDAETKLEDLKEAEPAKETKKPANAPANTPPPPPASKAPAPANAPSPTIDKPLVVPPAPKAAPGAPKGAAPTTKAAPRAPAAPKAGLAPGKATGVRKAPVRRVAPRRRLHRRARVGRVRRHR